MLVWQCWLRDSGLAALTGNGPRVFSENLFFFFANGFFSRTACFSLGLRVLGRGNAGLAMLAGQCWPGNAGQALLAWQC